MKRTLFALTLALAACGGSSHKAKSEGDVKAGDASGGDASGGGDLASRCTAAVEHVGQIFSDAGSPLAPDEKSGMQSDCEAKTDGSVAGCYENAGSMEAVRACNGADDTTQVPESGPPSENEGEGEGAGQGQ